MDLINLFKHFPDIIILFSDEVLFKLGHINKYFRNLIKNNDRYIEYLEDIELRYLFINTFKFPVDIPTYSDRLRYLLKDRIVKIIYQYVNKYFPFPMLGYIYVVKNECEQKISITNYKNMFISSNLIGCVDDTCLKIALGSKIKYTYKDINILRKNQYFMELLNYHKINSIYEFHNIINNLETKRIKIIDIVKK